MVKEATKTLILEAVKKVSERFFEKLLQLVHRLERKLLSLAVALIFIVMSIIFLAIAFVKLLDEVLSISSGLSFLIIGVVMLFIGLMLRMK